MTFQAANPDPMNETPSAGESATAAAEQAPALESEGDEGGTILGGEAPNAGDAPEAAAKDGEATGQAESAAGGPPETYDLKAPEGQAFDTQLFNEAEPVLRELGLSNEQAQKLVDVYAGKIMPALTDRANQALAMQAAEQRKAWADAFESDSDIGGANKTRTIADAARAFDHYGLKPGEGLRQLLDESGLGNHPDLIRFVAKVGRDLGESPFDRGAPVTHPKTPEAKLYGPEFQPK